MNKIELMLITKHHRENDLKEWVDYYLAIGFDKITIYDNESKFSITDLFVNYSNVVVIETSENHGASAYGIPNRLNLYNSFCNEKRGKTEWVAILEDDEYLYLKDNKNINEILNVDFLSLCFYWKFISLPEVIEDRSGTLIDTFNYSTTLTPFSNHSHIKSIVNLNKCENLIWKSPHCPTINNSTISYNLDGVAIGSEHGLLPPNFFDNEKAWIYHYYHQSYEDRIFKVTRSIIKDTDIPYYPQDRGSFIKEVVDKYPDLDNNMINKKKELKI